MEIKNKYYKHSRLSEEKFEQLIDSFARDLSATEAAIITGISLRTTNTIYLKLRYRLAAIAEEAKAAQQRQETQDGSYGRPSGEVFGVKASDHGVHADVIPLMSKLRLRALMRDTDVDGGAMRATLSETWDVLVDFDMRQVWKVRDSAANDGVSVDPVDAFLSYLRGRLQKFNGIASHTFYLHLKETEYRYHHIHQDIGPILLALLSVRPLEFSIDTVISKARRTEGEQLMAA
jgi:transposase